MTHMERNDAECLLNILMTSVSPCPASWIHRELNIRQPYPLWLTNRVLHIHGMKQPDDYCFVIEHERKECYLSPTLAILAATAGGGGFATKVQVAYCQMLSEMFKHRDPIEMIDTAIKTESAREFFEREMDPEK